MKLLYVINSLGQGGAERSLVELLPFFGAAGIQTVVVCLRDGTEYAELARARGASVEYLPRQGLPAAIMAVRRAIQTLRPALVHTTIFDADLVGRLAAARTGVPVLTSLVNTAYDPIRRQDPNVRRFSLSVYQHVDGISARHLTDHFHAITHAVKDAAVRDLRLDPGRITVIPRGRDATRFGSADSERRARVRRALGLDLDAPVLVNVGRQEFQKGQTHLLDAMTSIVEVDPATRLLVVGREGHSTAALRSRTAALGLEENVWFLGFRSDVADVLAAADIFVFPSLYEGLGGAVIEAMAMGLPVVASDLGPLREVVEHDGSGYLVPAGVPAEIAVRVRDLLAHPEKRTSFGRRGRQLFEQKFTIERSAEQMIALYRSLVRS